MSEARLDLSRPCTRLTQLYVGPQPDLGVKNGDCCRTAIAMLLGMERPEDVPHSETWAEKEAWLRARGAYLIHVPLPCKTVECLAEHLPSWLKGCPALLTGRTSEGHAHIVAIIDDKPVDTVDWTVGNPLVQPGSDGFYWLSVLVPARREA